MGWLIGRLADAGYQKVITRLPGGDQERALKTVDEISPASQEQADPVAEKFSSILE